MRQCSAISDVTESKGGVIDKQKDTLHQTETLIRFTEWLCKIVNTFSLARQPPSQLARQAE